jgi:hypothetical protein
MKVQLIHWSELDYQDNNDNLHFGLEVLDDELFSVDCFWFESDTERKQFILDNYAENSIIK